MSSVDVAVYEPDGTTLIAKVPRRQGVKWQDELNTPGVGSMQIHLDDPTLTRFPNLLDEFNIVRFSVGGVDVKGWIIESLERTNVADSDRYVTVSGRGNLAVLSNAVVYPEYPLRWNTADQRSFDFGSKDGGWRVTSDWVTPVGIAQGHTSSIRKGYPTNWPDPAAYWLWSTSPNAASAIGFNYFRRSFTLAAATRVTIYAAGDDRLFMQLDGEQIFAAGVGRWKSPVSYTAELAAGTHLIAAAVHNIGTANGGTNAAGFLYTVCKVDHNNKILGVLAHSAPGSDKVRGYGTPPGWFGPSILKTLVTEAGARGVEGFSSITFGFTDTVDSSGAAWTGRHDRSFEIGTRDLLDVATQLSEIDFDIAMSPSMTLHAYKQRGTDKRATVKLTPAVNVLGQTSSSNAGQIRTRALVRHGGGWIEYSDGTAAASYGRRETGLVVGNTSSDSEAQTFSQAAFNDLGKPEVTMPVTTTSVAGPQPWVDYNVGDIITAPGLLGDPQPGRLMSLSVEESENMLTFAHELYPES